MPSATRALLESLVRIDSVNPSLDSAGGGEKAIGCFIADFCRDRKLEFKFQDVEGERRRSGGMGARLRRRQTTFCRAYGHGSGQGLETQTHLNR